MKKETEADQILKAARKIFDEGKEQKVDLAEYLGKPKQRVNEWFTGKHEPREAVLKKIEKWVKARNRKKK